MSDDVWRSRRRGKQQELQYCADSSQQEILHLRALQGHSGRNAIDRLLQDIVLTPNSFFEYIYHIGCAVNLHSITHSGLIRGGQNSSKNRQTVFIPCIRIIKTRESLIRPKHVLHLTSKSGKCTKIPCIGSIFSLLNEKNLSSIQKSNAVIFHDTPPAFFNLESNCDEI